MKLPIATTYACRSLARHPRRSFLSMLGIGIGCAISLVILAWVRGERAMLMKAAASTGTGHLCLVPSRWVSVRTHELRLADWEGQRRRLDQDTAVLRTLPHARIEALIAFGTRSAAVEMLGVDPVAERAGNRLVRQLAQGRYLEAEDRGAVVLGQTLLDRLRVELGDELMVTVAGPDGQMRSAMLHIVGVVATGSRDMDAGICHVTLAECERLSGLPGAADVAILLRDPTQLFATAARLAGTTPAGSTLLTWDLLRPELAAGLKVDETSNRLTVLIVMLVVFLGIAGAQLAAVLERRREFAVLAALGMPGARLVRVVVVESLLLGGAGGAMGLALGLPPAWYLHTRGVDFSKLLAAENFTVSNVLIDPVYYGDLGWWVLPAGLALALAATLLGSLYPAWYAIATEPANALRNQ